MQLKLFFIMALCGGILSVIYALIFVVRFCFSFKRVSEIIFDALFCLISAVLFIVFLDAFALGEFRLYLVFGCALGFILVRLTVFNLIAKLTNIVYNRARQIYRGLKKIKLFSRLLK